MKLGVNRLPLAAGCVEQRRNCEAAMITRIEVDGFRSFVDFSVMLGPLQIIAGPNAAGKSNFFDALALLARLADLDSLSEAFAGVRGEPLEQFTTLAPGKCVQGMRFAVEAILPTEVRDRWGGAQTLSQSHLRYELQIRLEMAQDRPIIRIAHERLSGLRKKESLDRLGATFALASHLVWGARQEDYIGPEGGGKVVLHQDGRAGRKREFRLADLQGTVLSGANSVTFRHAFAMRQELSGLRFLQLEPSSLRAASPMKPFLGNEGERLERDGRNLPAVLARLEAGDGRTMAGIVRDLRSVVPDVRSVEVLRDETQRRLVAMVGFDHGGPFPASLLSEGTLRLLALSAIKHDPQHAGVLCFEEPENGIHPLRMRGLLGILEGLAGDRSLGDKGEGRLRQLIVNTHSPALVSVAPQGSLLFAETFRHFHPELDGSLLATRFLPVVDELPLRAVGSPRTHVTRVEVRDYLSSVDRERWHDDAGERPASR